MLTANTRPSPCHLARLFPLRHMTLYTCKNFDLAADWRLMTLTPTCPTFQHDSVMTSNEVGIPRRRRWRADSQCEGFQRQPAAHLYRSSATNMHDVSKYFRILIKVPNAFSPMVIINRLTPTVAMWVHCVPDWVKPSFVIFDIRALWRSGLSARVSWCQKLQMTALPGMAQMLYNSCTHRETVGVKGLARGE